MRMLGARLLVDEIETTLSLEVRAQRAGLELILEDDVRPRPTQGRVVSVGTDPLLKEEIAVGDVVFFAPTAGNYMTLQGKTFRQLEHLDVTSVMSEEEYQQSLKPITEGTPVSAEQSLQAQPVQHYRNQQEPE